MDSTDIPALADPAASLGGERSSGKGRRRRPRPARQPGWASGLLLFFLAPLLDRLLTGAFSPGEFFSPMVLLASLASLGAGAVLLRELAVRRNIGPWGRLLLGLALGLFYEGFITRQLFATEGTALGTLVGYGRVFDTNVLWGLLAALEHALQAFLLPLLAIELLWPTQASAPALQRRTQWLLLIALGICGFFGVSAISVNVGGPDQLYHPQALPLLGCALLIAGLLTLALRLRPATTGPDIEGAAADSAASVPQSADGWQLELRGGALRFRRRSERGPSPRALGWLAGLATALLLFILPVLYKEVLHFPAWFSLVLSLGLLGAGAWLAGRLSGRLDSRHRFALLFSTQLWWVLVCLLLPLDDGLRPDEYGLLPLLGLSLLGGLLFLRARLLRDRKVTLGAASQALT